MKTCPRIVKHLKAIVLSKMVCGKTSGGLPKPVDLDGTDTEQIKACSFLFLLSADASL